VKPIENAPAPLAVRIIYFALGENDEAHGDLDALSRAQVGLEDHNTSVGDFALRLVGAINLPTDLAEAVVLAGAHHDLGKDRPCWQQAIGNFGPPLAKSDQFYFDQSASGGYRHEFGSMLEAAEIPVIKSHSRRELILHLIAAQPMLPNAGSSNSNMSSAGGNWPTWKHSLNVLTALPPPIFQRLHHERCEHFYAQMQRGQSNELSCVLWGV
jgi:CRISPR-associated helicase Cas3